MKHLIFLLALMSCSVMAHAQAQQLPCVIRGTVYAAEDTSAVEEQVIERLKTVSTNAQFVAAMHSTTQPAKRPAAGAVVMARGKRLTQRATTDAAGQYSMRVMVEEYEVSASMPGTDEASASKLVYADRNRPRDLQLRNNIITIKGKVTNADGKPIAGAKVVAEESIDSQTDEILPDRVTTTTAADGTYELNGIESPHLWKVAGFLSGGTGGEGFMTGVTATAPGMKKQTLMVPPITETRLARARQLHQTLAEMAKRAGGKGPVQEKERTSLPKSKGNEVLDIDITLKPE
jgi:Carboxypeptidase regulatory-like domain